MNHAPVGTAYHPDSSPPLAPLAPLERWLTAPRSPRCPRATPSHAAPALSFEFFPPKTEALEKQLWLCVERLQPLAPRFVSVTYGAGGTTQERTHATVARLVRETTLTPAAHLTCVGASRAEVDAVARSYWEAGVRHIVAPARRRAGRRRLRTPSRRLRLRVRPRRRPAPRRGFRGLGRRLSRDASNRLQPRAGSGEPQAEARTPARRARSPTTSSTPTPICAFSTAASRPALTAPIVPGIMPVSNFAQCAKFSAACGVGVPDWLAHMFDGMENDAETRRMVAAFVAAEQVRLLQANGIDEFHFYTLNRPDLTFAIAHTPGRAAGVSRGGRRDISEYAELPGHLELLVPARRQPCRGAVRAGRRARDPLRWESSIATPSPGSCGPGRRRARRNCGSSSAAGSICPMGRNCSSIRPTVPLIRACAAC